MSFTFHKYKYAHNIGPIGSAVLTLYICLAINNRKFSRLVLEDIFIYVGIYTFIDVFSVIQGP